MTLFRIPAALWSIVPFLLISCASSRQFVKNPERLEHVVNIAIAGIDCDADGVGNGIVDGLSSQLLMSKYNIIEREKFLKILDEQRLTLTDFLSERESIVGRIKGVDAIIVGNASVQSGWAGLAFGGYKTYISTARMIDVATGEVLLAVTYSNSNPSTNATPTDIGIKLGKKIMASK